MHGQKSEALLLLSAGRVKVTSALLKSRFFLQILARILARVIRKSIVELHRGYWQAEELGLFSLRLSGKEEKRAV